MKKFFALALVVFGLAACQTEPEGLDVNMDGTTTISVVLPEDAMTRAGYTDSAQSGLANTDGETIRVVMRIYDEDGRVSDNRYVDYLSGNERTVNFDVRLVPNRQYTFVAWADQVMSRDDEDNYFVTSDLSKVTFINGSWTEMNENRDAYTATHTEANFTSASNITLTLTRPFAKLRVVTTDMVDLKKLGIEPPFYATMSYTEAVPTSFNAISGTIGDDYDSEAKVFSKFVIKDYASNTLTNKTLFTDYVLIPESNVVKFTLDVYQDAACTKLIKSNAFTTDIPVKRNNLTTIQGNILTDGTGVNVTVDEVFENQNNATDAPYYQEAVTNAVDLIKALMDGKEIIVLNDITVTAVDVALATRSGEAINPVINLNGYTITIENKDSDALVNLNGGTLTVEGNGAIMSNEGALVEGTTVVTEGANVEAEVAVDENGVSAVKSGLEALVYICKNGGEFNFTEDLEAKDVIFIETTKPIVINGNNKTITSSASRVFRIIAKANVTINNLNIVSTTVLGSYDSVRGISMDGDIDDIVLTLNNCSVDFTADTAHDWSYAINKVGETSKNVQITINGGTYEGANVVNIWGNENIITINGATLNNLYRANESYCGCCIRLEGSGNIVNIDNTTFTGAHAVVVNEKTPGANTVNYGENNNTDNLKRYCFKAGSELYYTLKDAVDATTEGEIKVLASVEMIEKVTIAAGKNITLNLNGRTISGKTFGNTNPQDLFLVKGNLTVNNGTITVEHVGENMGWGGQGTIFNITAGGVVNLNAVNAKYLGGTDMGFVAHLNNWGEVTLNVEGSTLEANYVAVRVFNSGNDKNNVTINNSTLKGGNYAFWVHNYTVADFGTVEKAEAQKALLNFDIFNGTNTFEGKNNTPIRYGFTNAIYTEAGSEIVSTVDELIAALKACKPITLGADITVTEKWDNRYTGAKVSKAISIDGNGKTLKFACEVQDNNNLAAFRFEAPAVVKNLTFDLSEVKNKCAAISTKGNIIVDNCTFIGSTSYTGCRGIRFGEGAGNAISDVEVAVTNSTFTNFGRGITDNENGQDAKSVTITGNTCTNAHVYVSAHDSIVFTGNTLVNSAANFISYTSAEDATVVATDNTLDANMAQYNIIRGFAVANIECQEGFNIM